MFKDSAQHWPMLRKFILVFLGSIGEIGDLALRITSWNFKRAQISALPLNRRLFVHPRVIWKGDPKRTEIILNKLGVYGVYRVQRLVQWFWLVQRLFDPTLPSSPSARPSQFLFATPLGWWCIVRTQVHVNLTCSWKPKAMGMVGPCRNSSPMLALWGVVPRIQTWRIRLHGCGLESNHHALFQTSSGQRSCWHINDKSLIHMRSDNQAISSRLYLTCMQLLTLPVSLCKACWASCWVSIYSLSHGSWNGSRNMSKKHCAWCPGTFQATILNIANQMDMTDSKWKKYHRNPTTVSQCP